MVDLNKTRKATLAKKEKVADTTPYLSTGVTLLDLCVGGGVTAGWGMGYKAGSIVRDWGDSSSSKSFKICQMIAANKHKYKDKFKYCYLDIERGNNINTEKLYGFNIHEESWKPPIDVRTVEDWFYVTYKFMQTLKPGDIGALFLDSLDAITDSSTVERKEERIKTMDRGKDFEKGTMGMAKQKFLSSEMFAGGLQADCDDHKLLLYVVGQARENVGVSYGAPLKANGGKAQQFAESVRIQSAAKAKDEKEGVPVSVQVYVRAEKMRHDKPFRSCQFPVVFDYGLDNIGANVDYLYELRSDRGELLGRADAVCWGSGEPLTDESLEAFLEENEVLDECIASLKKKYGIKNAKKWLEAKPELFEKFEARFGKTMTRDELIAYVEANGLEDELEQRVIAKWDAFEASIASNRKKQFSD